MGIRSLPPWALRGMVRAASKAIHYGRRAFGTIDRPDVDRLYVENGNLEQLARILGRRHFASAWKLSFRYRGEDLNMRRPMYDTPSEWPWKQDHVRGFETEGGVELVAHREIAPGRNARYAWAHWQEREFDLHGGLDAVATALEDAGVEYELVLSEA